MYYEVMPYTIENLKNIVKKYTPINPQIIENKYHFKSYFPEYLSYVQTKTIIVETKYIDRDFLEDYAGFYVRCFSPPSRECVRVHFFRESLSEEFEKSLTKENSSILRKLKDAYLGFVVLKCLPETVIGRTCLCTYPKDNRRFYSAVREYEANLFGIPLTVKTLAFQEQDRVAAACATSALWSVFNGTGTLFQHPIPSPLEITRSAIQDMPVMERMVPNDGLTLFHIANAIRHVGLEPLLFSTRKANFMRRMVRAYVDFGIPLLLQLLVGSELHAVAVTGYSLPHDGERDYLADSMDKIYVHDDQIGPFARMTICEEKVVPFDTDEEEGISLDSSWDESVVALNLIIPVYHKIRIKHEHIFALVKRFEYALDSLELFDAGRLTWDIRLTSLDKLKGEILSAKKISDSCRKDLLVTPMPRFLWRATAYPRKKSIDLTNDMLLDFIFDATDIEQGRFFVLAIEYDPDISSACRKLAKEFQDKEEVVYDFKGIIEWFQKTTGQSQT